MFSALPLRADIAQQSRHVRFVPDSELRWSGGQRATRPPIRTLTAPEARTQVGHQAMSEKCQRRKWWCDVVMSVLPLTSDLSCHAARGKLSVAF